MFEFFLRGVDVGVVLALDILEAPTVPADFAKARIRTKRSAIARGVGVGEPKLVATSESQTVV